MQCKIELKDKNENTYTHTASKMHTYKITNNEDERMNERTIFFFIKGLFRLANKCPLGTKKLCTYLGIYKILKQTPLDLSLIT